MRCMFLLLILFFTACHNQIESSLDETHILKASSLIEVDGFGKEEAWKNTSWKEINHVWLGDSMNEDDFKGRYKILWSDDFIYVLAEIEDDVLMDIHKDGLDRYWDDDCLEIFIDENNSKDNHQYNHSAFAYHISLNNRVVDIGPDSLPHYYDDHIKCKRIQNGKINTWEVAMSLYDDNYIDGSHNTPITLGAGKEIGFMVAYCDNDKSAERENFIGSIAVEGKDKNRGWIDSGVFATYKLR